MCKRTMIQDVISICPRCHAPLKKFFGKTDIFFICQDCKTTLKIVGPGKSERETECEFIEQET